jgi:magnesium transporter
MKGAVLPMSRPASRRSQKAGLPPGALVHVGERRAEKVEITICEYSESSFEEFVTEKLEDLVAPKSESAMRWVRVEGIHNVDVLGQIGKILALHPLTVEDILNTDQRPKIEDFDDYVYIVAKMLCRSDDKLSAEQISLIVRPSLVISFHETRSKLFLPLVNRLRAGKGRIRQMNSDYLAYAMLDTVVDNYFVILEEMGETIESLEEQATASAGKTMIRSMHEVRSELVQLRRAVWPLRDVLNILALGDSSLVSESTRVYFKDVHDHVVHAADTIEIFRETMTEMLTIYLTTVNNRLNEVMKVLTVIATIFMPLTLMAGIYGMNFEHMPELHWEWGYPSVLLLMLTIALSMLIYFRKRRWL